MIPIRLPLNHYQIEHLLHNERLVLDWYKTVEIQNNEVVIVTTEAARLILTMNRVIYKNYAIYLDIRRTKMSKSNTKKQDKDLWATPLWLFQFAERYFSAFKFDLDVCALPHNTKVPDNFITPEQNTLVTAWNGNYCWCNPPYSNPLPFVEKAIEESHKGKRIVMLLNVDNSTKWFELCARFATKIVFLTGGRVAFIHNETGEETKGNNKGQMLVFFAPYKGKEKVITHYININQAKTFFEENP